MNNIVEVKCASFGYNRMKPILHDISFTVNEGEILAVMGCNGIGKTTLLKCIAGIFEWTAGSSFIMNRPSKEAHRFLAYVPQAKAPSFSYTVLDFVSFGRCGVNRYFAAPSKKDYEMSEKILTDLHIDHLKNKHCNRLSGGEMQMAYIAKALVSQPRLLILDEPESNLDFYNQAQLLNILQTLSKSNRTAIIINSHYIQNIIRIADKGLLLADQTYLFSDIREVITQENIQSFFNANVEIVQVNTSTALLLKI